jgi:hypothetical protein
MTLKPDRTSTIESFACDFCYERPAYWHQVCDCCDAVLASLCVECYESETRDVRFQVARCAKALITADWIRIDGSHWQSPAGTPVQGTAAAYDVMKKSEVQ